MLIARIFKHGRDLFVRLFIIFNCLVIILFLAGCGENENTLGVKGDDFNLPWQEELTLDVTINDTFTGNVDVIITAAPTHGELSKSSNNLIYTPYEKTLITDSFQYKLKQGSTFSEEAIVQISLGNNIEQFELSESVLIEDGENNTLIIRMAYQLQDNIDIKIDRYINEQLDLDFTPIKQTLIAGKSSHLISYTPSVMGELKFEKQHSLRLSAEAIIPEKINFDYTYLAVSEPNKMFLPRKHSWYTQDAADLMLNQRGLSMSWLNYPTWNIPPKPTWAENPYKNNSWLLYYHSLFWLFAYEYAYDQSDNEEYLYIIGNTLLDYLKQSPKETPKSSMSWNDHTVSLRTDVITYFYNKYFKARWSEKEKEVYFIGLDEHASELRTLLDNPVFKRHNHGMFHALSLYNFVHAFPKYTQHTDYKSRSIERIMALFDNMVDIETGVSLEQSSSYQLVSIRLFLTANRLIKDLSGNSNVNVELYLKNMVDYSAHLVYPNGKAPASGDSNYGANFLVKLNKYIDGSEIESLYLDYVNSEGSQGKKLEQVFTSQKEGYAILRPAENTEWNKGTVLYSDFGLKKYSHGHHDAMSFTSYSDGYALLIDSGGPYVYTAPERTYYRSKYAHNTLVIDGVTEVLNDAKLLDAQCIDDVCYSFGQLVQEDVVHSRLILIVGNDKPNIYVFDYVDSTTIHKYELIYHFPPTSSVLGQSELDIIQIGENKSISISVLASTIVETTYFDGYVNEDFKQGWVTPKYAKELAAPVISYTSTSDFYWSLTQILQKEQMLKPQVTFDQSTSEFLLILEDKQIVLDFSDLKNPQVLIN